MSIPSTFGAKGPSNSEPRSVSPTHQSEGEDSDPADRLTVLGISCWYHDSAACLLQDGRIVAAAQEERFTRRKHDPDFPTRAIEYCLREAGLTPADIDAVAFYDKPFLKFERLLETYVSYAPRGLRSFLKAMPLWLKQKLWIPDLIRSELGGDDDSKNHDFQHMDAESMRSTLIRAGDRMELGQ